MKRFVMIPALAVALLATSAFAQALPPPESATFSSLLAALAVYALPLAGTAVLAVLAWGLYKGGKLIDEKAGESKWLKAMARLVGVIEAVVRDLQVGMRAGFERAAADGKITPEEAKQLKDEAMRLVKESLGMHGWEELRAILNMTDNAFAKFVSGLIEMVLDKVKATHAAAKAGGVVPSIVANFPAGVDAASLTAVAAHAKKVVAEVP